PTIGSVVYVACLSRHRRLGLRSARRSRDSRDWSNGGPPMNDRPARPFRVLMLSWEFPPQVVGGLGRHVQGLSRALAAAGHQVTVLTRAAPDAPTVERVDGVRVLRPLPRETTDGLSAWAGAVTHPLARDAIKVIRSADAADGSAAPYDVVHAHDWLLGT